jgi:hypothetical protein
MKAIVCLTAGYPFDLDQNRTMQKNVAVAPPVLAASFDASQFDPGRNH